MARIIGVGAAWTVVWALVPGGSWAQTFTGSGMPIPDDGTTVHAQVVVSGLGVLTTAHGLAEVCINIVHPYCSDLTIALVAPDGRVFDLVANTGGSGDDFTNTCFSDAAGTSIIQGQPPFTGSYRALAPLGDVNDGAPANGPWRLRIRDVYPLADAGTMLGWSLTFGPGAPGPFTLESTNLPIVLLDTDDVPIPQDQRIPGGIGIIHYPPGQNVPHLVPNVIDAFMGIRVRGHFSSGLPQKPYSIKLRNDLGQDVNAPLLGMPPEHDWILLAGYNDKSLLRNPLSSHLFRRMGHWAPRMHLCEVVLNGGYQGVYALTEQIKRDNGRLDIATLNPHEISDDDLTGGYIFKVDYFDATDSWASGYSPIDHPELDVRFVYEYPSPTNIVPEQKTYLQGFVHGFETALYGPDFADPSTGYRAWIDTRSFIDYFLVNELSRNADGFKKSRFFHKDKDSNGGLLKAGPVWDFDWAWMNVVGCNIFSATDGSGWAHRVNDCEPDNNSPGWMVRLLQDTLFANELRCRYTELRNTVLSTEHINTYIDSVHALVEQGAQQRHFHRWPVIGVNSGTPEMWPLAQSYPEELQRLKDWTALRLSWLDAHMPGQCITSGLPRYEDPGVRVFPNPAVDVVHLEHVRPIGEVVLRDATGRIVRTRSMPDASRLRLDVGDLPAGMYVLLVRSADGRWSSHQLAVAR